MKFMTIKRLHFFESFSIRFSICFEKKPNCCHNFKSKKSVVFKKKYAFYGAKINSFVKVAIIAFKTFSVISFFKCQLLNEPYLMTV